MDRLLLMSAILMFGSLIWLSQITLTPISSAQYDPPAEKSILPMAASFEFPDEIVDSVKAGSALAYNVEKQPMMFITSHHLPVAAGVVGKAYATLAQYKETIDTVIIIGPDHFEHCNYDIALFDSSLNTNFGPLHASKDVSTFVDTVSGAGVDNDCFISEHATGVQAHYISHVLGNDINIIPISISAGSDKESLQSLATTLASYIDEKTLVIGSIDFSHYETADIARATDAITWSRIEQLDTYGLTVQYADTPGSLFVLSEIAKTRQWTPHLLEAINSYEILGEFSNTTGYLNIAYY